MPVSQSEKLYGLPGPQNSAVLMEIITKLKHELQQSKAENNKLVDQLNCLISLVKRAWTGEQGAMIHLANIIGLEAPAMINSTVNRNTPVPEKTRAVENWERFAIKLLQKDYAEVQAEIQERQKLYLQNRQMYMQEVIVDHEQEMSRYGLHKKTTVEDVDRQFLRCFSAKKQGSRPVKSAYRPRSAYRPAPRTAADMVERTEVNVADLIGNHPSPVSLQNRSQSNTTMSTLYRIADGDRRAYRPQPHFDDPNRYRQNNLFDPDVIFSPEMMAPPRDQKDRPGSATSTQSIKNNLRARPKSAVFLTDGRPDRPLKYETTRPVSGKPSRQAASASHLGRRNSAPTKKSAPTTVKQKALHSRKNQQQHGENGLEGEELHSPGSHAGGTDDWNQTEGDEREQDTGHVTGNQDDLEENGNTDRSAVDKAPIKVNVKKNDPVDKFVEELKLMSEMENDFKRSAVQLQKKLGLESSGFVY